MPSSLIIFMDLSLLKNDVIARAPVRSYLQLKKGLLRLRLAMTGYYLCGLHLLGKVDQLLCYFRTDACLGFFRACPDVRRADHVIELEQFPVCWRFFGKDIQCCARDLAAGQCFIKRLFIDNPPACAVDNADAILHFSKLFCS